LPYNFFLEGIGGGFGHPGHPPGWLRPCTQVTVCMQRSPHTTHKSPFSHNVKHNIKSCVTTKPHHRTKHCYI